MGRYVGRWAGVFDDCTPGNSLHNDERGLEAWALGRGFECFAGT